MLSKFSHPHIVKMVEARVDDESSAIVKNAAAGEARKTRPGSGEDTLSD